jgi:hypothetical protein
VMEIARSNPELNSLISISKLAMLKIHCYFMGEQKVNRRFTTTINQFTYSLYKK